MNWWYLRCTKKSLSADGHKLTFTISHRAGRLTFIDIILCLLPFHVHWYFHRLESGNIHQVQELWKFFNIRHFAFQIKVLIVLVYDLLYAGECKLVMHREIDMWCFMQRLSETMQGALFIQDISNVPDCLRYSIHSVVYLYWQSKKLKFTGRFT